MPYLTFFFLLLMPICFSQSVVAETLLRLTLPKAGSLEPDKTSRFYEEALHLALTKTSDGSERIQLDNHTIAVNRERARLLVKQGVLDVVWGSSSKKREKELIPVKFSLIRGISEYRLLLIREADQPLFDKVKTLADLQAFKIGTGTQWSDTEIYRFNGLPLVTSYAYRPMFRMLSLKRFDYMARGLQEVESDLKNYGELGLVVEKNLAIHYTQPIYFFVNDSDLATRIQKGLELAQQDGSLDILFFSIPSFRDAWERLQKIERRLIELKTPNE